MDLLGSYSSVTGMIMMTPAGTDADNLYKTSRHAVNKLVCALVGILIMQLLHVKGVS